MTQLNEVRIMNDTMLLYLKKLGMDYRRNEIIKKILEDESCFFKMDKNDAYIVLRDVGIENDNIDNVYSNLISNDMYYELYKSGKINENDSELVIKYDIYDEKNLFKKKNTEENIKDNQIPMIVEKENVFRRTINKIKEILHLK